MPRVSVILPTYNRAYILNEAIDSVLRQTFQDFELIVVDDGSEDDTQKLLDSYDDRRLKVVTLPKNKGFAHARNIGIKDASADLIAFQDSDDLWLKNKLKKQYNLFNNNSNLTATYTGSYHSLNNEYRPLPGSRQLRGKLYPQLILRNTIFPDHAIIKKEIFEETGLFDETLASCVDTEWWIRTCQIHNIGFVDEPLHIFRPQPDSMTAQEDKHKAQRTKMAEKHLQKILKAMDKELNTRISTLKDLADNRPLLIWGTGAAGEKTHRFLTNTTNLNITGWVDSFYEKTGSKFDKTVYPPEKFLRKFDRAENKPYLLIESVAAREIENTARLFQLTHREDYLLNWFQFVLGSALYDILEENDYI